MTMFKEGSVLARPFVYVKPVEEKGEQEITEKAFFESVQADAFLESIERANNVRVRNDAASACVEWVHGGDSSIDNLDATLFGLAGGQDDVELNDGQNAIYESLQTAASEFIVSISDAQESDLAVALEDEEAANRIFESLENALSDVDSDEAIADFSVREQMLLEATKKVVRNGEIVVIKTNRRKRRMSAAQKAALKKARSKANTAGARAARKKAARLRKSAGL